MIDLSVKFSLTRFGVLTSYGSLTEMMQNKKNIFMKLRTLCFLIVFLCFLNLVNLVVILKFVLIPFTKPFSTMFLQKLEGKTQPCLYHVLKTLFKINFFCISFLNTINEFYQYIIARCTDFKLTY